ncbi:MAG: hypothetical protein JSU94_08250 [Phycisphaerales bacterium]|nr:MAG: hypothetical protein JSU94_08250 [Phycisphaerales bacterium]
MREENESWLLPIVEAFGTEYLVDIERREFRQFNDPANVVKMHSERGRQIVKECLGQQWHSFGLDTMADNSDMVGDRCGNRMPAET